MQNRPLLLAGLVPLALLVACGSDGTPGGTGGGSSSTGSATSSGTGGASDGTLITTDKGPVQGQLLGSTREFLGIPFAAPPVGDLRWKPPQPAAPWKDAKDATKRAPYCAQLNALSPTFDTSTQEDCLTLNVWTPKDAKNAPVFVWIHGGSFLIGSGAEKTYDGRKLSESSGAIVVTINYRLGPLGFLALTSLENEDPAHPSTGMYGIEDQRAALQWVKANAAAFGGDPGNVTVAGESAGGVSACLHLLSPASKGLFQHAIIESGSCDSSGTPGATAKLQGDKLSTKLGCDIKDTKGGLSCLRGKKPEEVLLALPSSATLDFSGMSASWFPSVDGFNIPDQPTKLFDSGSFTKVDTLLGSNGNEGSIFFALGGNAVADDAAYLTVANGFFPGKGDVIVAHYTSAMFGSPKAAAIAAAGDGLFVCPARRTARAITKAGVSAYLYHFAYVAPDPLLTGLGSFHSSELPFVFGNSSELLPNSPSAAEKPLETAMMGYWGQMIATGNPNGKNGTDWPKYDATADENIVLDTMIAKQSNLAKADCDFWDSL